MGPQVFHLLLSLMQSVPSVPEPGGGGGLCISSAGLLGPGCLGWLEGLPGTLYQALLGPQEAEPGGLGEAEGPALP